MRSLGIFALQGGEVQFAGILGHWADWTRILNGLGWGVV
jgi:hypothetical protein